MYGLSTSLHYFNARVPIFHDFLEGGVSDMVVSAYNHSDKIDNTGNSRDNLFDTERTNWKAHRSPEVKVIWNKIAGKFNSAFSHHLSAPFVDTVELDLFESWIANSGSDAFVEPHSHGPCPFIWSFVFYARIPSKASSLNFISVESDHIRVDVREGDLLFFPSNIGHYSNHTESNRTIFSGNFSVKVTPKYD